MNFFIVAKQAGILWLNKSADQYAAALAYFTPFALTPLLLISITIVGILIGRNDVVTLLLRWGADIDPGLPNFMQSSVENFEILTTSYTVPIFALLFFSVFIIYALNSLSSGLQHMWSVNIFGWRATIKRSFRSALFVVLFQIYLVTIIILNNISLTVSSFSGLSLLHFLPPIIFFALTTLLISLGYGLLPLEAPDFKSRLYGALVATTLFLFTKTLVAIHIATSPEPTIYGAAGLIFVLLIWFYMSSCIIYYGAAFAKVYSDIKSIK